MILVLFTSCQKSQPDLIPAETATETNPDTELTPAPADSLPAEALARVEAYFQDYLKVRYMEKNCQPVSYSGWEGFPLQKCRYSVKDRKTGNSKVAEVIMLNASPKQLARWVVYTCLIVKGSAEKAFTDKLSKHIIHQSGAQFPVAGIVYEDLYDAENQTWQADGINEIYCFRNGVTVVVDGVKHMGTEQPSEAGIEKSLSGRVLKSMKFARIQSTTREQYRANGGTVDVGDSSDRKLAWLTVVRDLYQAAWSGDRNELMIAWARANL